jgi:AraC family transcriptional regulator of adaptative response/methylated-DNA-[protein]-cysteine methyltransferase
MVRRDAGRAVGDADWAAHEARAPTGLVWAVVTTGIHCRDGCPARPLRRNLRVFATRDEAEAAGFRACKRCGGGPAGLRP